MTKLPVKNTNWPMHIDSDKSQDLFMQRDGYDFAGIHLLVDCWQASNLNDLAHIESTLREAVEVTGATLLHIHLHHFTPNGGVSGVAVLAESHISIHTWPERDYAALDIFMCGDTQPENAIKVFEKAFETTNIKVAEHLRGKVETISNTGVKP
jgi:S-adenosylmethionine decarboxylase